MPRRAAVALTVEWAFEHRAELMEDWRLCQSKQPYRLAVTFQDGVSGVVDLSGLTSALDLGVFAPLKDQAYFGQARLELGAVTWPNGADLDPAWMHDQIAQARTWSVPF